MNNLSRYLITIILFFITGVFSKSITFIFYINNITLIIFLFLFSSSIILFPNDISTIKESRDFANFVNLILNNSKYCYYFGILFGLIVSFATLFFSDNYFHVIKAVSFNYYELFGDLAGILLVFYFTKLKLNSSLTSLGYGIAFPTFLIILRSNEILFTYIGHFSFFIVLAITIFYFNRNKMGADR